MDQKLIWFFLLGKVLADQKTFTKNVQDFKKIICISILLDMLPRLGRRAVILEMHQELLALLVSQRVLLQGMRKSLEKPNVIYA
jgi:hypothetical protein